MAVQNVRPGGRRILPRRLLAQGTLTRRSGSMLDYGASTHRAHELPKSRPT